MQIPPQRREQPSDHHDINMAVGQAGHECLAPTTITGRAQEDEVAIDPPPVVVALPMLVMRTSVAVRLLPELGADSPARYAGEPDYTPAASARSSAATFLPFPMGGGPW